MKWLQWGDKNTKFFHATTIQRRERNKLQRIKNDEEEWVEGQEDIQRLIKEYFQEIYKPADSGANRDCINLISRLVTDAMNERLMSPVSEGEIRNVVFELGALKALGPDGLNGLFYQKH